MDCPVGKSTLESMPVELLEKVANLALDVALGHTDANARAAYKKGTSKLLTFCLVSKKLKSVVRPAIFRHVSIRRSSDLILLFRTLTENREVGGHIRQLTLTTTFLRQGQGYEALDLQLLKGIDPDFDLVQPHGSAIMTSRQENQIRINLYLKVLNKAPNVVGVTINIPSWTVRGCDDGGISALGIASIMATNRVAMPQISLARLPEALRVLTIEGQHKGLMEGLPRQLSKLWAQESTKASKLEKMVWLRGDTTWFDSLPSQQWGPKGMSSLNSSPDVPVSRAWRITDKLLT